MKIHTVMLCKYYANMSLCKYYVLMEYYEHVSKKVFKIVM